MAAVWIGAPTAVSRCCWFSGRRHVLLPRGTAAGEPVSAGIPKQRHRGGGGALGDDNAREFMRSNNITITSLVDADGSAGRSYHVSGVPKLVLVVADGKVARVSNGTAGEGELRDWMASISGS
jgi:hypothetical protein